MTEFEDVIAEALRDEANRIEISLRHADQIFNAAQEQPVVVSRRERLLHRYGATRSFAGAALTLALVALVVVPLTAHENPNTQSALQNSGSALRIPLSTFGWSTYQGSQAAISDRKVITSGLALSHHGISSLIGASSLLRIEQTGSLSLFVTGTKFSSTMDSLEAFAVGLGGVVSNSQSNISHRAHGAGSSGYVVLNVPASRFRLLINEIRGLGRATSLQTIATDVTGQYTDIAARLHAAQISRAQYLTIMAQAHTIGAILSVQGQIDSIQSRIEQLQGQLSVLSHETTFSTLTVQVSTPGSNTAQTHTRTGFSKAWHDAISGFLAGFEWVIRVAGPLAFLVVLLGALALVVRASRRVQWRRRV
jgi:hypothetical protein